MTEQTKTDEKSRRSLARFAALLLNPRWHRMGGMFALLLLAVFGMCGDAFGQAIPVPQATGAGDDFPDMVSNVVNWLYTDIGPPLAVAATGVSLPMLGGRHTRGVGLWMLGGVLAYATFPYIAESIGELTGWF